MDRAMSHRPMQLPDSSHSMRRHLVRQLQFVLDLGLLTGSFAAAYLLRFEFAVPADIVHDALVQLPLVVLLQLACLKLAGVYNFIWRYVGLAEMKAFVKAAAASATPLLLLRFGLSERHHVWRVPVSIIVFTTVLAFGGALALRIARRLLHEPRRRQGTSQGKTPRVLLVGAGRAGVRVARELDQLPATGLRAVGFVDDDAVKLGTVVQGVPVLGAVRDLPRLIREHAIGEVILTINQASRRELRRILDFCEKQPVMVRIVPGLGEVLDGAVTVSRLREVQIEDLLGRAPVEIDEPLVQRTLRGKRVLVTGAGGSIGSEIARQISRFEPACLLLVDRCEPALFAIDRELGELRPSLARVPLLLDTTDEASLEHTLAAHRPQVVFHAAAHKHVPLLESHPAEALHNNVFGTSALGRLVGELGAETFVLISTDKAVRPSSVMGASKRLAELVVQDLDRRYPTRFMAVRFGNVMGSAGSVIPIFREQIRRGGPVTVTHEDMVRYFMTIPEAAQLVLQAGALGEGGEIFMLDMGEPVRILELAHEMIRLSGLQPFEDIDIFISGIRPGEKLHEELHHMSENFQATRHPKIRQGQVVNPLTGQTLAEALAGLHQMVARGHGDDLRELLKQLLPEAELPATSDDRAIVRIDRHRLATASRSAYKPRRAVLT